jgi:hypothetical protein
MGGGWVLLIVFVVVWWKNRVDRGSLNYQAALIVEGLASTPVEVKSVFTVAKASPALLGG